MKQYHDNQILKRNFKPGQMVLKLFNSRLKLFSGKLKSNWSGMFMIKDVKPYGAVELEDPITKTLVTLGNVIFFPEKISTLLSELNSPKVCWHLVNSSQNVWNSLKWVMPDPIFSNLLHFWHWYLNPTCKQT